MMFHRARSILLLRLFTTVGISLVTHVLVLNWLLNSIKCVVLFLYIGCGSEQVGLADLWGAFGVLFCKSFPSDSETLCACAAVCSAASL